MRDQQPIDIFKEVAKLNFPAGEYLIVGSGIMAVKGIRPAYDLDILVTERLFETCKSSGCWEIKPWTKVGMNGKEWLRKDKVELLLHLDSKEKGLTAKRLMEEAEIVQDIPFLSLKQLMGFKATYGRQKDFNDIELILNYLKNNQ